MYSWEKYKEKGKENSEINDHIISLEKAGIRWNQSRQGDAVIPEMLFPLAEGLPSCQIREGRALQGLK